MFDYKMQHLFSYSANLESPPEVIGPTPSGLRLNAYITGGTIGGPRLRGVLRPVGADWLTVRTDGVCILDVRATMESHDGALIYAEYTGVSDPGIDTYQRFLDGTPPHRLTIRGVPRMMTTHPDYLWLNRLQCVNVGEANLVDWTVAYDVYGLM